LITCQRETENFQPFTPLELKTQYGRDSERASGASIRKCPCPTQLAMQSERGMQYHAAVRSLAFKWLRIMFHCWKAKELYDDAKYTAQLVRKQSPIVKFLNEKSKA